MRKAQFLHLQRRSHKKPICDKVLGGGTEGQGARPAWGSLPNGTPSEKGRLHRASRVNGEKGNQEGG